MRLDLATVLIQWSAGGLFGGWLTTRHRLVSTGYGWLVRGVFGVLAAIGLGVGIAEGGDVGSTVRNAGAAAMVIFAGVALAESIARELGPRGIHVAYLVIDAVIDSERARQRQPDKTDGFFIDPKDDLFAICMLQSPSQRQRIQNELKVLIYQALKK